MPAPTMARIRAYSAAAAPDSSRKNFEIECFTVRPFISFSPALAKVGPTSKSDARSPAAIFVYLEFAGVGDEATLQLFTVTTVAALSGNGCAVALGATCLLL